MLNMSPFAPLLKPDLYWFSTVSVVRFSQWVVYACFCAIVIVVSLGLRCRFWRRPLRRLFSLVGWTGTLAPEMCIPQYEMAIACFGRKKGCPQGEVMFQLKCWNFGAYLYRSGKQNLAYLCCFLTRSLHGFTTGPSVFVSDLWCGEMEEDWVSFHGWV